MPWIRTNDRLVMCDLSGWQLSLDRVEVLVLWKEDLEVDKTELLGKVGPGLTTGEHHQYVDEKEVEVGMWGGVMGG